MADVTQNPADVQRISGGEHTRKGGDTITAGMWVYEDSADGYRIKPALATSATTAKCSGMAQGGGDVDQPIVVADGKGGELDVGATLVEGEVYVLSPTTPGGMCLLSDLSPGDIVTFLGIGLPTSGHLMPNVTNSGAERQ